MVLISRRQLTDTAWEIECDYKRTHDWEQWFLLTADHHWDNPQCDRRLLQKHLQQARERNAPHLVFGDLFCVMNGKYDPRRSKAKVRPEHKKDNYLDAVVDDAILWYKKFGSPDFVSPGNHEESILSHMETDITKRFANGVNALKGTVAGRVVLKFSDVDGSGSNRHMVIAYHHGYGGGGPVTKGTIQATRRAVYLPNDDICLFGHIHERWQTTITKDHFNPTTGKSWLENQIHLCLPTYKEEYLPKAGWHTNRGAPPKPLGGCWLRVFYDRNARNRASALSCETVWAT